MQSGGSVSASLMDFLADGSAHGHCCCGHPRWMHEIACKSWLCECPSFTTGMAYQDDCRARGYANFSRSSHDPGDEDRS